MRDVDVFQQVLGLTPPWRVEEIEFDPEAGRLGLYLDFPPGSEFTCPECGREDCTAYDTTEKTWRHLTFFEHRAYLHARVPRVECAECGVKLVRVPWAREGSGFTLRFEGFMLALVKAMPVAAVARLVGGHDIRLWRILHHYVDRAREEADFRDRKFKRPFEPGAKVGRGSWTGQVRAGGRSGGGEAAKRIARRKM